VVWTGLIWLRIGTNGRLLWSRQWNFGLHKLLGSLWVAAKLAATEEGPNSMQLYNKPLSRSAPISIMSAAWFHFSFKFSVGMVASFTIATAELLTHWNLRPPSRFQRQGMILCLLVLRSPFASGFRAPCHPPGNCQHFIIRVVAPICSSLFRLSRNELSLRFHFDI
jgi:hypothetical protein